MKEGRIRPSLPSSGEAPCGTSARLNEGGSNSTLVVTTIVSSRNTANMPQ